MRGLGIDLVSVHRFKDWHKKSIKMLQRVFHNVEITYCLQDAGRSAERFAVRFAAKEAFFKAFTQYNPNHTLSFLTFLSCCYVQKHVSGLPFMIVDWERLRRFFSEQNDRVEKIFLSISHEKDYAVVVVWIT